MQGVMVGSNESSGPPPPHPRRPNALLARLYDTPPYRDPLAWWTLAVVGFSVAAFTTPTQPTPWPKWLDVVLATLVMTFLFGIVPAIARLKLRRLLWRRRRQTREPLLPAAGASKVAGTTQVAESTSDGAAQSSDPLTAQSASSQLRSAPQPSR